MVVNPKKISKEEKMTFLCQSPDTCAAMVHEVQAVLGGYGSPSGRRGSSMLAAAATPEEDGGT